METKMDIAMVVGGAVIAMLQGMDAAGKQRSIESLHRLANRGSPAERHIFQVIADAVDGSAPTGRKPFEVIHGGAV
jgi:hypothetical protein